MYQLLHQLEKEYYYFNLRNKIGDIYAPKINGEGDISGFNMLIATLFASNHRLSGEFTTTSYLEENEIPFKRDCPKVAFVDFKITNTILFLKDQINKLIGDFQQDSEEDIKKVMELFNKGEINSFSPDDREEIEEDLGETYLLNIGRNILNYKKTEAIPDEYILQGIAKERTELSQEEKELKKEIENKKYNSFFQAQQELYILFYTYGIGNPKIIGGFELYEFGASINLFRKSNNNAVIAKSIAEDEKKKVIKQIKR